MAGSANKKPRSQPASTVEPEDAVMIAASARQVQAISNAIEETLRTSGKRPLHIEGYSSAEWILLDYGDFIVHVFSPASRRFYDLERLWRDAPRVEIKEARRELKTE